MHTQENHTIKRARKTDRDSHPARRPTHLLKARPHAELDPSGSRVALCSILSVPVSLHYKHSVGVPDAHASNEARGSLASHQSHIRSALTESDVTPAHRCQAPPQGAAFQSIASSRSRASSPGDRSVAARRPGSRARFTESRPSRLPAGRQNGPSRPVNSQFACGSPLVLVKSGPSSVDRRLVTPTLRWAGMPIQSSASPGPSSQRRPTASPRSF